MFQAVIFDWDGTLADTRKIIVASFQEALRQIGFKVDAEFIERRIGIGAAETFREILLSLNVQFDEELIGRLVKEKIRLEIELTGEMALFDGAKELLDALFGKVKIGLASMNNHDVIEHMVKSKNLEKYFQIVITAESIKKPKPDPQIFLECASRLDVLAEECVVVEDSIFGVKAAKSARMGCVAVTTGVYSRQELEKEKPNLIVKSLKDKKVLNFILH